MNRKLLSSAISLVAAAACAALPVSAQATTELVSSKTNSLCVNPTPGFEPEVGGSPNYAPITTPSSTPGEPFPDTGAHCAAGFPTTAVPLQDGGPGKAAWPYSGKLAKAEWVSYNDEGWDFSNTSPFNMGNATPAYYIYDETFTLCKDENEVAKAKITGTMFADNRAGAFLNGYPIGSQTKNNVIENFDGPPAGGFAFGTSVPADFKSFGVNTLQFVVMDQSPPFTALDFKAKVTWKCSISKGGKG